MSWSLGFGSVCGDQRDLVTLSQPGPLSVGLSVKMVSRKHSPAIENLEIPSSGLQGDGSAL